MIDYIGILWVENVLNIGFCLALFKQGRLQSPQINQLIILDHRKLPSELPY